MKKTEQYEKIKTEIEALEEEKKGLETFLTHTVENLLEGIEEVEERKLNKNDYIEISDTIDTDVVYKGSISQIPRELLSNLVTSYDVCHMADDSIDLGIIKIKEDIHKERYEEIKMKIDELKNQRDNLENDMGKTKYMVFEIETSYSEERYMCELKDQDYEKSADDFLASICFCDAYEITSTRDATDEEIDRLSKLLEENKEDEFYGLYEAQTQVMYPNHDSYNEMIMQLSKVQEVNGGNSIKPLPKKNNDMLAIKNNKIDKSTNKKEHKKQATRSKEKNDKDR